MTALGKTVRIVFLDGQERTFTNALVDLETAGWLHITRLQVQEGPISGVAEPVAGYRLEALKGWEYVEGEPGQQTEPSLRGENNPE
jgi:hypothetical protein